MLERLPRLDLGAARVAPYEAAHGLDRPPDRLRIAMLGERPVYRLGAGARTVTVFADDGEPLSSLERRRRRCGSRALSIRSTQPPHGTTAVSKSPDQWTLQNRGALPLHRITLGDGEDTWVYLSERSGELVMAATRGERRLAYVSAVPHWLYFTPLRRHGALWGRLVIALSLAGAVLAASGLLVGVWQLLRARRRSGRAALASPYAGLMRWHHYAGLVFGLFTFTWVASGCLSMDPWFWRSSTDAAIEQASSVAGATPSSTPSRSSSCARHWRRTRRLLRPG